MPISLMLCLQLAIASAVGAGLVAACRWLRRRSPLCAALVVAGLLVRAAVTLVFFWTSYLSLPILRQQQSGDGFWKLAMDATIYYRLALNAALSGLDTVAGGSPSPAFVKALALWMRAVGSSPVSGAYLNLTLYLLLCLMIVAGFRSSGNRRINVPCVVMLAAVSFSPVLVAYSSQPLKDMMFVFLIGIICLAANEFLPSMTLKSGEPLRWSAGALSQVATLVALLAAFYVIAGIRAYYAALAWSALALVLFVFAWQLRRARLLRYAAMCVLILAAAWLSFMAGAGLDYINPYAPVIDKVWALTGREPIARSGQKTVTGQGTESEGSMVTMVDRYRTGFLLTPGATNIKSLSGVDCSMPAEETGSGPMTSKPACASPGGGVKDRLSAVAVGLGLIFVPVSALRALSVVDFAGGRGLLPMADADTLFTDLTIVAAIAVLVRGRSTIRDRLPYISFAATLAVAAGVLIAYVVTNFGTLFRLRLMVSVPLWMLPLALSTRITRPLRDQPDDPVARLAARTRESFGYEWTYFHRWQDSGEISFRDCFETADLAALREGRVLDAGCGMGRHARQMAAHVRHVIAVDFSRAIAQAAMNTRGVGNVDCVQADLLRLPFPDGAFDYVYSLGVLHHLGNTETAVRALVAKLKPGGRLRVYLYWKRHGGMGVVLRLVNTLRRVTTRLPFWLLRWWCWIISVGLWLAVILPYRLLASANVRGMVNWPLFVYARYPFRILYNDQFDRFSAPLEKRYDPEEVSALLESAGLRDVRVEPRFGWIAEGVKPVDQNPCAG